MKDRAREEELRNSADTKYAHLNLPLHVEVSTVAPPAEAYARVAYALAELRRFMIPEKFDDIHQDQYRDIIGDSLGGKKLVSHAQQQNVTHNVNNSMGGYNSGYRSMSAHNGLGQYRHKYPPVPHISQQYHYAQSNQSYDENSYYRSHHNASTTNSAYQHMAKTYLPG